jgi:hypothetical protein
MSWTRNKKGLLSWKARLLALAVSLAGLSSALVVPRWEDLHRGQPESWIEIPLTLWYFAGTMGGCFLLVVAVFMAGDVGPGHGDGANWPDH